MTSINLILAELFVHKPKIRICCVIGLAIALQFNMFGQSRVFPKFLDGKEESKNYRDLSGIIGNIDKDSIYKLPACSAGIGTFSFEITPTGGVDVVKCSGNLPSVIESKIKQNILSTSGRWQPQIDDGEPVYSMPFIFVYYLNIYSCDTMPTYQRNEYQMSFLLEKAINSLENKNFTVLNNAYLLPVDGINLMRH